MTTESIKLLKQLRTYHNGTYAKAIDEAIALAESKTITECPMCPNCPDNCPLDNPKPQVQHHLIKITDMGNYECSCCHGSIVTAHKKKYNYCEYCGTKLDTDEVIADMSNEFNNPKLKRLGL